MWSCGVVACFKWRKLKKYVACRLCARKKKKPAVKQDAKRTARRKLSHVLIVCVIKDDSKLIKHSHGAQLNPAF